MTRKDVYDLLDELFGGGVWPSPLHALQGGLQVQSGVAPKVAARAVGTTERRLQELIGATDPLAHLIGAVDLTARAEEATKKRDIIGNLILGQAAEAAFEDIYRTEIGTPEFSLGDDRSSRSDTDYRLIDGNDRQIFRINIKFFGSLFRKAPEWVGLEPAVCFPLATYKIHAALKKQEDEHLPYLFLVVSVPSLTARSIADQFKSGELEAILTLLLSNIEKKRDIEDRFVRKCVAANHHAYVDAYDKIRKAEWFVLSARRADLLLKEMLFDRVFALRVRNWAQQFRNAELDMHFSLEQDLMPLPKFLGHLRDGGLRWPRLFGPIFRLDKWIVCRG